ncbi:MAG: RNA-binding protein [Nanoarchaeota archaeon]|nr:RNA-binding protein [Nanoarchaeota archaeon]
MSAMDCSNITRETLKRLFVEGKRFDGRGLSDYRDFNISFNVSNKAEGSARVKIGKTEVVVGVKMEVGKPYADSPEKGNLTVSGDLLPMASPRFEAGPPKFNAIELPRLVDRAIRHSGILDLKQLVITPGEKVWTVIIDIYPINDDGNIIDAATIGAAAALRKAMVPVLNEKGEIDYHQESKTPLPISKEIFPMIITFFRLGDSIILDPTREEEEACEARIAWGVSKWEGQYMINSCQKGEEIPLTRQHIEYMMDIIPKKFDEASEKLKKFF